MPDDELPVILVSAADAAAAGALISDLIGEEGDSDAEGSDDGARVWRLRNKYYSARVRVQAGAPAAAQRVRAHIVLLQPHEGVAELEARAAEGRRLPACDVRLALAPAAAAALEGAARRAGYEPVALTAAAGDDDDEDEPRGLARAREALHAHVWPGLRLRPPRAPPARDDDDDEWEWRSAPPAPAPAEERFAEALGALGAARAAVAQADLPQAQRLQRAEALLAAFCHALAEPDER